VTTAKLPLEVPNGGNAGRIVHLFRRLENAPLAKFDEPRRLSRKGARPVTPVRTSIVERRFPRDQHAAGASLMTLFVRELRNNVALRNATLLRIPTASVERQSAGHMPGALLPTFDVR
jgi:hypothetical protein